MKATIHLVEPETAYPVDIDARDRRAFERAGRVQLGKIALGSLKEVVASIPETYTLWLAWHALQRSGVALDWETFEDRVVEVESTDNGEMEADPTIAAPSGD